MSKISTVRQEKVEDIAEELDGELEPLEKSEEDGEYTNENLKAMLNYYIGEKEHYVVTGAVISCDQMSDKPVYIKKEGNRIEITGEMGKKVFQVSKGGQEQSERYEAHTDAKGARRLYAVHATDQTTGGRTFATVRDCICLRDKEEGKKRGLSSIISLGNCKLMEKTDAEEIEKRKKDAQKYGTCYCLIKPDDKWVNPYCMESVIGECHENNGGLNSVLPSIGAADILTPRPACKRIEHHSTMKWSTDIGLEEGITMLSTLLCTRGGIITVEKSGQVTQTPYMGSLVYKTVTGAKLITDPNINPQEVPLYSGRTMNGEYIYFPLDSYPQATYEQVSITTDTTFKEGANYRHVHPTRFKEEVELPPSFKEEYHGFFTSQGNSFSLADNRIEVACRRGISTCDGEAFADSLAGKYIDIVLSDGTVLACILGASKGDEGDSDETGVVHYDNSIFELLQTTNIEEGDDVINASKEDLLHGCDIVGVYVYSEKRLYDKNTNEYTYYFSDGMRR